MVDKVHLTSCAMRMLVCLLYIVFVETCIVSKSKMNLMCYPSVVDVLMIWAIFLKRVRFLALKLARHNFLLALKYSDDLQYFSVMSDLSKGVLLPCHDYIGWDNEVISYELNFFMQLQANWSYMPQVIIRLVYVVSRESFKCGLLTSIFIDRKWYLLVPSLHWQK